MKIENDAKSGIDSLVVGQRNGLNLLAHPGRAYTIENRMKVYTPSKQQAMWAGYDLGAPDFESRHLDAIRSDSSIRERFEELAHSPEFSLCFVEYEDTLSNFTLSAEDHEEILRLYDQAPNYLGHEGVGLFIPKAHREQYDLEAHYSDGFGTSSYMYFGRGPRSSGSSYADERIPHIWVQVGNGWEIAPDDMRDIIRGIVKALILLQLRFEKLHAEYEGLI